MNRIACTLVFLSLGLAAGCDLELTALTAPPPGAAASLDNDDHDIVLSRGAAMAVGCRDAQWDMCTEMEVEVADPAIAGARVAYRNALGFDGDGPQPVTAFVIFGRAAGETEVYVDASGGSVSYRVEVLEP